MYCLLPGAFYAPPLFLFLISALKSIWLVLVIQSWPTLCDPVNCSLPGACVHGILQARTLEWVAISFSNAWKWKVKAKSLSCVWLLVTSWTAAYQAPPSMGFSRQEYWSGVPFPFLGHLPNPGMEPRSSALQADSLPSEPSSLKSIWLTITLLVYLFIVCVLPLTT